MQFSIGATRLDTDGENEFLITGKSILQTPVKHRKESDITITAGSAYTQLKDDSHKRKHPASAKNLELFKKIV